MFHNFFQRPAPIERTWVAETFPYPIPQREELAEVVVVEEVVVSVVCAAVDDRLEQERNTVVSIVDGHRPEVDKHEQNEVGDLVQGEEERVDVVGQTLQESV